MNTPKHIPVLLKEIIDFLPQESSLKCIDCTLGLGGHTLEFVQNIGSEGRVLAFDQDESNMNFAKNRLEAYSDQITFVHKNFENLLQCASSHNFLDADFVFMDLGLSSPHIDSADKGFSFKKNGPLDMRFDKRTKLTAADIVNTYSEKRIMDILNTYGDVPAAHKVAREIVTRRKNDPIVETHQLVSVVEAVIHERLHNKVSSLVFQALRIAVNRELEVLENTLPQALEVLKPGGLLAVISYHSLEDRIVKNFIKDFSSYKYSDDLQALQQVVREPVLKKITKKPIVPTQKEIEENPRSRSAKLRIAQKIV